MAKGSREHALRDGSETALQLSVSMRSFVKRKQDLARPLADENRGNDPRRCSHTHPLFLQEVLDLALPRGLTLPVLNATRLGT